MRTKTNPRAGSPRVVGGHRRSQRCWLRQWGTVCRCGNNFAKVAGYFLQMRQMVLVQAEEQRPPRREAMKTEESGDIQTLGKMRELGSGQSTTIICSEA